MEDLFQREQHILDGALNHVDELKCGACADGDMMASLAREYGLLLKQLRKVVKISDKASGVLHSDRKYREEKITALENELLQNQISIMISQIQPHFLYNSLVAIQELCGIDPEKASEAVGEFSNYLRGNLDSLTIQGLIPFPKELRHVETYLSLEKKRFGHKLNVVFDISATDFLIPALTLQPVVENAVRHGVTKREDGGTVTVRTERRDGCALITVSDNGVGFDALSPPKRDGRLHIGIENVRNRLKAMCGGGLTLESKPGAGATAVIAVPAGRSVAP